jgi:hypothetical protein
MAIVRVRPKYGSGTLEPKGHTARALPGAPTYGALTFAPFNKLCRARNDVSPLAKRPAPPPLARFADRGGVRLPRHSRTPGDAEWARLALGLGE